MAGKDWMEGYMRVYHEKFGILEMALMEGLLGWYGIWLWHGIKGCCIMLRTVGIGGMEN